jgi:hypothetical protein
MFLRNAAIHKHTRRYNPGDLHLPRWDTAPFCVVNLAVIAMTMKAVKGVEMVGRLYLTS